MLLKILKKGKHWTVFSLLYSLIFLHHQIELYNYTIRQRLHQSYFLYCFTCAVYQLSNLILTMLMMMTWNRDMAIVDVFEHALHRPWRTNTLAKGQFWRPSFCTWTDASLQSSSWRCWLSGWPSASKPTSRMLGAGWTSSSYRWVVNLMIICFITRVLVIVIV